jgi:hypothetical protein
VSFHHYNRLLAHWQPKIRPEGQVLAFGSKERFRSLTPGAVAVAQFVAGHLNTETNCYAISQKTIEAKLGLAKTTIGKALDELVAWGVFARQRSHYEKPYEYYLAIDCPEDCAHSATHYTSSELATLPKKQATPITKKQETPAPKEQATGGLENRQLIETNKETNKEMNRTKSSCFNCSGDFEILSNGNKEIIHTEDCSQLKQIKQGQAWNITQGEVGSAWDYLDNRAQQIANYLSLAKARERKIKQAELITGEELAKRHKFDKIITRTLAENNLEKYDPLIHEWLWIYYKEWYAISDTAIERAVRYTRSGWRLKNTEQLKDEYGRNNDWRKGAMITSDHFIEGENSND